MTKTIKRGKVTLNNGRGYVALKYLGRYYTPRVDLIGTLVAHPNQFGYEKTMKELRETHSAQSDVLATSFVVTSDIDERRRGYRNQISGEFGVIVEYGGGYVFIPLTELKKRDLEDVLKSSIVREGLNDSAFEQLVEYR